MNKAPISRNITSEDFSSPEVNQNILDKYAKNDYWPFVFLYDRLLLHLQQNNIAIFDLADVEDFYKTAHEEYGKPDSYKWFPLRGEDIADYNSPKDDFTTYEGYTTLSGIKEFGAIYCYRNYPLLVPESTLRLLNIIRRVKFSNNNPLASSRHVRALVSFSRTTPRAFLGITLESEHDYDSLHGRRIIVVDSWIMNGYYDKGIELFVRERRRTGS